MAFDDLQARKSKLSTYSFVAEECAIAHIAGMRTRGDRIRYIRTEVLGLDSQEELAERLGVTRGAVGNWEQDRGIDKRYLLRLANLGNTTVEWIESGLGPAPGERAAAQHFVSAKSKDDACVSAAVEGMLCSLGLTDSQAIELRELMREVLQEQISGRTPEEIQASRKTLAQFVTSQFLRNKGLKDGEK